MTAFTILSSTSHALTGSAYTFQPDSGSADSNVENNPKPWLVRVWGDVNFHINVATTSTAATTADMPVTDHHDGILLSIPPGGFVSVIKKSGEPDGEVWFTHVKRL